MSYKKLIFKTNTTIEIENATIRGEKASNTILCRPLFNLFHEELKGCEFRK